MFQGVFRGTRILLDGRNRFPINIKYTQTRKRNDRKRIAVLKENARILREGKEALESRIAKERLQAAQTSKEQLKSTGAAE